MRTSLGAAPPGPRFGLNGLVLKLPQRGYPQTGWFRLTGEGHVAEQTRGIFETIAALLAAHDATLADVVNIRTCLTDIGTLEEYGTVRRQFLTGTPPTSMTFEVPRLFRPEALVEVEVVAAVSPRPRGSHPAA